MALAELPPRVAEPASAPVEGRTTRGFTLTVEHLLWLAILALAVLTRLWGLDNRALHHDETLHARISYELFRGQGFIHDPLLHGPTLYYLVAAVYFLFGDNDYTARLAAALFNIALVLSPWLLRRELGRPAALLAGVFLLISPVTMYVGRFIRHDPFTTLFEVLVLISIVRYASTRRVIWLYLGIAALTLMATTMETYYLYLTIFLPVVVGALLWKVWKPGFLVAIGLGALILALVFVLPGYPQRPFPQSDTVNRVSNERYVCPTASQPFPPENPMLVARPGPIFGLPPLATFDNNYALCVRHQPDNNLGLYLIKLWQFFGHPAILFGLVAVPLTLLALGWAIWRRPDRSGMTPWQHARTTGDAMTEAFASLAHDGRWWKALLLGLAIYTFFFTATLTNPVGFVSGTTGSLLYWLAQHEVERGGQPPHYYLVMLGIYEPLVILWSGVGMVAALVLLIRRLRQREAPLALDQTVQLDDDPDHQDVKQSGDLPLRRHDLEEMADASAPLAEPRTNGVAELPESNGTHAVATGALEPARPATPTMNWEVGLPVLLLWWSVATVGIYSWAGEKMPWLTIHLVLPLALLGAWGLAQVLGWAFRALPQPPEWASARTPTAWGPYLWVYLGLFGAVMALCYVLIAVVSNPISTQLTLTPWVAPLAVVLIALLTIGFGLIYGARRALGALALGLVLTAGVYQVRSAYQLNFLWGDVPREMMIYTQTSPDVRRVIDNLEMASIKRTAGLNLPIWYDNETVWDWYFRRFRNAQEQFPQLRGAPPPEVQAVFMLTENYDDGGQNRQFLNGFAVQRYPLRWWFPEDQVYRLPRDWLTTEVTDESPLLMRMIRTPFDGRTSAQFWQYLLFRRLHSPLGSTDFVVAVRPDLVSDIGIGTGGKR